MRRITDILRDGRGATAIEYGLIVAVIVIAIMVGVTSLAQTTIDMWGNVATKVVNA